MLALDRISFTAALAALATLLLLALHRHPSARAWLNDLGVTLLVGATTLLMRVIANTPVLNDDPFGVLSPNDLICPVVVFLVLRAYGALRHRDNGDDWEQRLVHVAIIVFAVNVLTI